MSASVEKNTFSTHSATLIEAYNITGMGEVRDHTDDRSRMRRIFTFDQIAGYGGQTMREMGLLPGREVSIVVGERGRIQSVIFSFEDRYKRFLGIKLPFQDYLDDAFPGFLRSITHSP
ncbi:MAG: hypothetical protein CEO21_247 [Microgenomates group bacterium Gr01-1014_80]|nr:MAG: hypothetical protein CEO21_247 [Microgenomates group bacterium Gr01-1014_80]